MNSRDIIYELIQGELEDKVYIYDPLLKMYFEISSLTVEDGESYVLLQIGREVKA